jgi:hypothetical protein
MNTSSHHLDYDETTPAALVTPVRGPPTPESAVLPHRKDVDHGKNDISCLVKKLSARANPLHFANGCAKLDKAVLVNQQERTSSGSASNPCSVTVMRPVSVRSASFPLKEECYHALVEYKYAGKGVPDHWSQFWFPTGGYQRWT